MEYEPPTDIIRRVGEYLRAGLPNDEVAMRIHLADIDRLQFDLTERRVDWLRLLSEKKNQMLHPKDKDLTDMDRKIMLNASVAVIERDYEFLVKLEELVKDRIELGKLFLTV